jgi:hypothetical protein
VGIMTTLTHNTPLLFQLGPIDPTFYRHDCDGDLCLKCSWATWGITRSFDGRWYDLNKVYRAGFSDNEAAAVLPGELVRYD